MKLMNSFSDYTEHEFVEFMYELFKENASKTDEQLDILLAHFERITEHPEGTDLIYYASSDAECTPEVITKKVKEWRTDNGRPGFKEI